MWERTLQDLIRGLRANKKDESKFISKAVDEIRTEIKSEDMELKAGAVLKLTYLDMLGYDMSWASFHVVEVMSSPRYHLKTVGYLAATQTFNQDTDVLMLTTNLLKKDLTSTPADVAVTLNGISHIVTPDLARDLSHELLTMLTHSRANIRKRAVLVLYKVITMNPDVAERAIGRLKEKLDDPDPGVVAATVNVICELARRNPSDYLDLAPQLFHLMTTSPNNWMLIKIIKLFGSLSPHEPRLVKKLQPPITELISTTPAISLLYECVHTCIIGGMLQGANGSNLARLCVSKLAAFIQDSDQNLKYIALLAMVKIVPTHPHLVAEYQDTILASVNDQDISIRMRALDLVSAMVREDNLQSIVQQILSHLAQDTSSSVLPTAVQSLAQNAIPSSPGSTKPNIRPTQSPAYRLVLCERILTMCSQSMYENVTNFEWYLSVLVDLAHIANVDIGKAIRDQLVDIVGRVKSARRYAVKLMYSLLSDDSMLLNAQDEGSCSEVLWAAAWICGEYCSELAEPQKLIPYFLRPEMSNLTPDIIAVYLHAAVKVFGYWAAELAQRWSWANDDLPDVKEIVESMVVGMKEFVTSPHIEVQERAANAIQLFNFIQADLGAYPSKVNDLSGEQSGESMFTDEPNFPKSLFLLNPLFSSELNPVAVNAQASVPVPAGLDLDAWIVPPPAINETLDPEAGSSDLKKVKKSKKGKGKEVSANGTKGKKKAVGRELDGELVPSEPVETAEERAERERRKAERLERLKDDPYYIIDDKSPPPPRPTEDVDSIPIVRLDDMPSLIPDFKDIGPSILRDRPPSLEPPVIDRVGEMPEGAVATPLQQQTSSRPSTPAQSSSFPAYDVAEDIDIPRTNSMDPIKVTRVKKKKGTGKKKPAVV
ncbi:AP-3 complex subunit delta [Pleurotus pulmonarius]|nr:AP-3 complex subunit delta [Pleurotus pulmonarius]KAF4606174.1 AP-3 complex subunit delta [Pleurotus pulmonarius]